MKQREDSAEQYQKAGRPELAEKEQGRDRRAEGRTCPRRSRTPRSPPRSTRRWRRPAPRSPKDMGKVMKAALAALAASGKAVDGKRVNEAVQEAAGRLRRRSSACRGRPALHGRLRGPRGLGRREGAHPRVRRRPRRPLRAQRGGPGAGGRARARAAGGRARRRARAAAARSPSTRRAGASRGSGSPGRSGRRRARSAAPAARRSRAEMGRALADELRGLRHPLRLRARAWTSTRTRGTP